MSYETWHNYGYGICTDEIICDSVEKMQELLKFAPKFKTTLDKYFTEAEIDEPSYDDYIESDQDYHLGLATILFEVIKEAEKIEFLPCDNVECQNYLIYPPSYPWGLPKREKKLNEDKIRAILQKYVTILTDQEIEITYQSVENGG